MDDDLTVILTGYTSGTGGAPGQYEFQAVTPNANGSVSLGTQIGTAVDPNASYGVPPPGGIIQNNQLPVGAIVTVSPSGSGDNTLYTIQDTTVAGDAGGAPSGYSGLCYPCMATGNQPTQPPGPQTWQFSSGYLQNPNYVAPGATCCAQGSANFSSWPCTYLLTSGTSSYTLSQQGNYPDTWGTSDNSATWALGPVDSNMVAETTIDSVTVDYALAMSAWQPCGNNTMALTTVGAPPGTPPNISVNAQDCDCGTANA